MSILLQCKGFVYSGHKIPEFTIYKNSFCKINTPFTLESKEDLMLFSFFQGKKRNKAVHIPGELPLYSSIVNRPHRIKLLNWNRCKDIVKKLSAFYKVSEEESLKILQLLDIDLALEWELTPLIDRYLSSLAVALFISSFVFFDTSGLDPMGSKRLLSYAKQKVEEGKTLIQINYPDISGKKITPKFDFSCQRINGVELD